MPCHYRQFLNQITIFSLDLSTIRSLVPKERPTIARRFNAGINAAANQVPKGRPNARIQPPLRGSPVNARFPGVKTPGYFQKSLRD